MREIQLRGTCVAVYFQHDCATVVRHEMREGRIHHPAFDCKSQMFHIPAGHGERIRDVKGKMFDFHEMVCLRNEVIGHAVRNEAVISLMARLAAPGSNARLPQFGPGLQALVEELDKVLATRRVQPLKV